MSSCLLCGYTSDTDISLVDQIHCCSWCVDAARNLSSEARLTLADLAKLPMAFKIWSHGRREDSSETTDFHQLPVQQPAEVSPSLAPGLFLGDLDDAADIPKLLVLGVSWVFILCPERLTGNYLQLPLHLSENGIKLVSWPADDSSQFDIVAQVLDQGACEIIDVVLLKARVLVVCWGGVNRSAAVAIAFLTWKRRLPLLTAVRQTIQNRGTVLTNHAFRHFLVRATESRNFPLR
jgi:hypothetical protein